MKYGPMVIDLDILFYSDDIVSEPGLEIPHPRIRERPFVLVPLNEIRPELVHPALRRKASELLGGLDQGRLGRATRRHQWETSARSRTFHGVHVGA